LPRWPFIWAAAWHCQGKEASQGPRGLSREKLLFMSVDREIFWLYAGRRASYDEGMTSNYYKSEKKRGYEEAFLQFEILRAKWPKAFPAKGHQVRPLASGAVKIVATMLGWSPPYARAVLQAWKLREAYCRAVLAYSERITLDGAASGEVVDDVARALATERLAVIKARRARQAEEQPARTQLAPESA
jgi:ProQ/FINO family